MAGALRQLSFGIYADGLVEYLRLSMSLLSKCRKLIVKAVLKRFQTQYQQRPTADDLRQIMDRHANMGFPGALRFLDCSGWKLSCFSVGKKRRTVRKAKTAEFYLESECDANLWIWRMKLSFPGAMNDINIMEELPLSSEVRAEVWPP